MLKSLLDQENLYKDNNLINIQYASDNIMKYSYLPLICKNCKGIYYKTKYTEMCSGECNYSFKVSQIIKRKKKKENDKTKIYINMNKRK